MRVGVSSRGSVFFGFGPILGTLFLIFAVFWWIIKWAAIGTGFALFGLWKAGVWVYSWAYVGVCWAIGRFTAWRDARAAKIV